MRNILQMILFSVVGSSMCTAASATLFVLYGLYTDKHEAHVACVLILVLASFSLAISLVYLLDVVMIFGSSFWYKNR